MKNFTRSVLLTLLAGILSSTTLCAQTTNDLSGTWTVDFDNTVLDMMASSKTIYDSMSTKAKKIMRESFETRTFTFSGATVMVHFVTNNQTQDVQGQWNYVQASNLLTITVHEVDNEFDVVWQDGNHIKFIYHDVPQKALIKSLTLSRN